MTQELWHTSAPRGLKPGTRGFCTVVCTQGMPINLADRLELLSGYRHLFAPEGSQADLNPVAYNHVRLIVGGRKFHVLSRIGNVGTDYSGRSNKFAHHVVLETHELPQGGPAWLLREAGFMETCWDGQLRVLPRGRSVPNGQCLPAPCKYWGKLVGDPGWAGMLAETVMADTPSAANIAYLIVSPGTDVLRLMAEAVALLPPPHRWKATFSTYYLPMSGDVDCRWRAVYINTPEAAAARRRRGALCLDLTGRLPAAEGTSAVEAARRGAYLPDRNKGTPLAAASRATENSVLPSPIAEVEQADSGEYALALPAEPFPPPPPLQRRWQSAGTRSSNRPRKWRFRRYALIAAGVASILLVAVLAIVSGGSGKGNLLVQLFRYFRQVRQEAQPPGATSSAEAPPHGSNVEPANHAPVGGATKAGQHQQPPPGQVPSAEQEKAGQQGQSQQRGPSQPRAKPPQQQQTAKQEQSAPPQQAGQGESAQPSAPTQPQKRNEKEEQPGSREHGKQEHADPRTGKKKGPADQAASGAESQVAHRSNSRGGGPTRFEGAIPCWPLEEPIPTKAGTTLLLQLQPDDAVESIELLSFGTLRLILVRPSDFWEIQRGGVRGGNRGTLHYEDGRLTYSHHKDVSPKQLHVLHQHILIVTIKDSAGNGKRAVQLFRPKRCGECELLAPPPSESSPDRDACQLVSAPIDLPLASLNVPLQLRVEELAIEGNVRIPSSPPPNRAGRGNQTHGNGHWLRPVSIAVTKFELQARPTGRPADGSSSPREPEERESPGTAYTLRIDSRWTIKGPQEGKKPQGRTFQVTIAGQVHFSWPDGEATAVVLRAVNCHAQEDGKPPAEAAGDSPEFKVTGITIKKGIIYLKKGDYVVTLVNIGTVTEKAAR